jgi:hypothetical protein
LCSNFGEAFYVEYTHIAKSLPGKFQEAENIIYGCFACEVELDTVVYNTFIKSMLESGLDNIFSSPLDGQAIFSGPRVPCLTLSALVPKQANYTQLPAYMIA